MIDPGKLPFSTLKPGVDSPLPLSMYEFPAHQYRAPFSPALAAVQAVVIVVVVVAAAAAAPVIVVVSAAARFLFSAPLTGSTESARQG